MLHPYIVSADAEIRYQQRLEEAEAERLYQRLKQNRPDLLEQMNDFYSHPGHKLKREYQPKLGNFSPGRR